MIKGVSIMKRLNFKTIIYLLFVFLFVFGVLYLMWTGANYLFIENHSPKANTLDVVMIVIIAWYATKDFFFEYYIPRRRKNERSNMSTSNHQYSNQ
jgi:hypothetical protein